MKKPFPHTKVSNKRCLDCNKPLKANLVNNNEKAIRCWVCWRIIRGLFIASGQDLRNKQAKNRRKWNWKSK